jgi:uncharacterized protein with HEPN domain
VQKLVRPYLYDIAAAITGIEQAIAGKSADQYAANWTLRRAVERGVEIISEASRRLPQQVRDQQPQIPWQRIIGIGNVLRHDYRNVVDSVIFAAVRDDLPALKVAIAAMNAALREPEE